MHPAEGDNGPDASGREFDGMWWITARRPVVCSRLGSDEDLQPLDRATWEFAALRFVRGFPRPCSCAEWVFMTNTSTALHAPPPVNANRGFVESGESDAPNGTDHTFQPLSLQRLWRDGGGGRQLQRRSAASAPSVSAFQTSTKPREHTTCASAH